MWCGIVNKANSILPAGDVRIGPLDYNIYSNSQLPNAKDMNDVPLKAIGNNVLRFGDIGQAEDSSAIQYNIVRVDGQKSVYLPILQAGRKQQHHPDRQWHSRTRASTCSIFPRSWSRRSSSISRNT